MSGQVLQEAFLDELEKLAGVPRAVQMGGGGAYGVKRRAAREFGQFAGKTANSTAASAARRVGTVRAREAANLMTGTGRKGSFAAVASPVPREAAAWRTALKKAKIKSREARSTAQDVAGWASFMRGAGRPGPTFRDPKAPGTMKARVQGTLDNLMARREFARRGLLAK